MGRIRETLRDLGSSPSTPRTEVSRASLVPSCFLAYPLAPSPESQGVDSSSSCACVRGGGALKTSQGPWRSSPDPFTLSSSLEEVSVHFLIQAACSSPCSLPKPTPSLHRMVSPPAKNLCVSLVPLFSSTRPIQSLHHSPSPLPPPWPKTPAWFPPASLAFLQST